MSDPLAELSQTIEALRPKLTKCFEALGEVIVGQRPLLERLLVALMVDGHVLLEGAPGLAKTLIVRSLARMLELGFKRIQLTPDLLPADILGTQVFHPATGAFAIRKGPVFANVILADEINRAPAKVQSALLEAMQERQVTLGDESYPLPRPFLVLATQNPIEHEGTYPLPEAQLDRFLMNLRIGYPSRDEELAIVERLATSRTQTPTDVLLGSRELAELQNAADQVYLDERVRAYIVDLVQATRQPASIEPAFARFVQLGASPRASIFLARAAKGLAILRSRAFVLPQDVRELAGDVLRHRIVLTFEAEAEGITVDQLLSRLVALMPIP